MRKSITEKKKCKRCVATTRTGGRCGNTARTGEHCYRHQPPAEHKVEEGETTWVEDRKKKLVRLPQKTIAECTTPEDSDCGSGVEMLTKQLTGIELPITGLSWDPRVRREFADKHRGTKMWEGPMTYFVLDGLVEPMKPRRHAELYTSTLPDQFWKCAEPETAHSLYVVIHGGGAHVFAIEKRCFAGRPPVYMLYQSWYMRWTLSQWLGFTPLPVFPSSPLKTETKEEIETLPRAKTPMEDATDTQEVRQHYGLFKVLSKAELKECITSKCFGFQTLENFRKLPNLAPTWFVLQILIE